MNCRGLQFEPAYEPLDIRAEGAAPIVVIGTTRDPATPYEEAVALADPFESGVLVSRDGDGHTAYNKGNDCINRSGRGLPDRGHRAAGRARVLRVQLEGAVTYVGLVAPNRR